MFWCLHSVWWTDSFNVNWLLVGIYLSFVLKCLLPNCHHEIKVILRFERCSEFLAIAYFSDWNFCGTCFRPWHHIWWFPEVIIFWELVLSLIGVILPCWVIHYQICCRGSIYLIVIFKLFWCVACIRRNVRDDGGNFGSVLNYSGV